MQIITNGGTDNMTTWHLFLNVDLSTKGQKRRVSWAMCLLIFFVTQKVFYALTSSFLACSRCSDGRQIKNIESRERSKKRMGKEAREHLRYSGTPSDRSILTLSVNTQAPLMQLSNAIWRCQYGCIDMVVMETRLHMGGILLR